MFGWPKFKFLVARRRLFPVALAIVLYSVGPWALFATSEDIKEHRQRPGEQRSQAQPNNPISNYCWILPTNSPSPRLEVIPCDHAPKRNEPTESGSLGKAFSDALLLAFNGMLALFTYRLVKSTDKLWSATKDAIEESRAVSERQAKEFEHSFNVALQSADATIRAVDATRESTELARENAERQLRAYVLPVAGYVERAEIRGTALKAVVEIRNAGQTPAYKMTHSITADVRELPLTNSVFDPPYNRPQESYIGPGTNQIFSTKIAIEELEYSMINMSPRLATVFVWGRIDYIDAFDKPRWTTFRLRLGDKAQRPFVGPDRWDIDPCEDGNETEED